MMVSVLIMLAFLFLFILAEASVLYYFFVVRQARIDKEYNERMDQIQKDYMDRTGNKGSR